MTLDTHEDIPLGANFAVRRQEFNEVRFDPTLGRTGNNPRGGDDVTLVRNIIGRGRFGVWVADARVRHCIPSERMTQEFLWNYYLERGKDRARDAKGFSGFGKSVIRHAKARVRLLRTGGTRNERWAREFKAVAITRGYLDGVIAGA